MLELRARRGIAIIWRGVALMGRGGMMGKSCYLLITGTQCRSRLPFPLRCRFPIVAGDVAGGSGSGWPGVAAPALMRCRDAEGKGVASLSGRHCSHAWNPGKSLMEETTEVVPHRVLPDDRKPPRQPVPMPCRSRCVGHVATGSMGIGAFRRHGQPGPGRSNGVVAFPGRPTKARRWMPGGTPRQDGCRRSLQTARQVVEDWGWQAAAVLARTVLDPRAPHPRHLFKRSVAASPYLSAGKIRIGPPVGEAHRSAFQCA